MILVDLYDGPRTMRNIVDMAADDVRLGSRVVVRVERRDGVALPVFVSVEEGDDDRVE